MNSSPIRVLCCGTFDYLHPGHLHFLKQASSLGDELFVVVARDENVERIKGRRPDQNEGSRLRNLLKESCVVDARLGYLGGVGNFLKVVCDIRPNVIALGYDQSAPPGLEHTFPDCRIVVLDAHFPERFKSSLYRHSRDKP